MRTRIISILLLCIVSIASLLIGVGTAPKAYASVSNPTYIGTPGYIDASTLGITDSTKLSFTSSDGIAPIGPYNFAEENIVINKDGGSTINGKVMLYNGTTSNYNNGYPMIPEQDLSAFVSALGGNLTYVESKVKTLTATDSLGQTIQLINLSRVVDNCGATYESSVPSIATSGNTITETYKIQTSLPPVATSVSVAASSITAGSAESISAHVEDDTYNTGYHRDAISVTGPKGTTHWLAANGSWTTDTASDEKNYYNHYNGGNTQGYTGSAPALSNFQYTDTVSFPTTANSPTGTYTVKVWMMDALKRPAAATVSTTFTVGAGVTSGGGGNPSITLTASPSSLTAGNPSTLTATASNAPSSNDTIKIIDESSKDTLNGSNTYSANNSTYAATTATDKNAESVNYEAELLSPSGAMVATATTTITWKTSAPPTQPNTTSLQLSAKPTVVGLGGQTKLTVVVPPDLNGGTAPMGEFVQVYDASTGQAVGLGANTGAYPFQYGYNNAGEYESFSVTYASSTAGTQQFIAKLWNPNVTAYNHPPSLQSNTVSVQWVPPTISLSANPTSLFSGQTSQITYSTTGVATGDYVDITGTGGQDAWNVTKDAKPTDAYSEIENPANNGITTVKYIATLYNSSGKSLATAHLTVTWTAPTITINASPKNVFTGESSDLSYTTTGMISGEYVSITGTGGKDAWNVSKDSNTSDTYKETENPTNGGKTTVQYVVNLYSASGSVLASSNVSVVWQAPTISMSANPKQDAPGQSSTISYSINIPLPQGYSVQITPSGNGSDMWQATGLTTQTGTYNEIETPSDGQTISANYTATIISPAGNPIATGTTSVLWTNAWNGQITLSATPQFLPSGDATSLTAKTSMAIPNGYSLIIKDESTGQVIAQTSRAQATTKYTSFKAATDTFVAYLNDGYMQVGSNSNTVTVVWSQLALLANPTQLPANSGTTLTVIGQNVPSGDYLVIDNQSTGQVVGYSKSTPYSTTVVEPSAQRDTFVAYISSSNSISGAYATSNSVIVDWYALTLTVNPSRLPINDTSTLTATAQGLPSGYVIDIVDNTTNKVIATGQPGIKTLQAFQTKSQVETDDYVAQVVQPGNPPIPGLNVPGSSLNGNVYIGTLNNGFYKWNGTGWSSIGGPTNIVPIQFEHGGMTVDENGDLYVAYAPESNATFIRVDKYNVTSGTWADLYFPYIQAPISADGNHQNPKQPQYINAQWNPSNNTLMVTAGTWAESIGAIWNGSAWTSMSPYSPGTESLSYDPSTHEFVEGTGSGGETSEWSGSGWTSMWQTKGPDNNAVVFDAQIGKVVGDSIYYSPQTSSGSLNAPNSGNIGYLAYVPDTQNLWYGNPNGTLESWNQSTGWSSPYSIGGISGLADDGSTPLANSYGSIFYFDGTSWINTGYENAYDLAAYGTGGGASYFPYWSFNQMPSFVPTSLFTQPASPSGEGYGFWVNSNMDDKNGSAFFETTFNLPTEQQVTVTIPTPADDFEAVYLDGKPVLQNGYSSGYLNAPNTTTSTLDLPAGLHQVIIEGLNTNGFGNRNPNPARVDLQITGQNGQTLVANNASSWLTTGYATKLPSGWFSSAIGTYNFTEYVMQENTSPPIYQQQSYSVQTTAQNVSAQTNPPLAVTWFNPITPPDNFTLAALPTHVVKPAQTMFKIGLDSTDQGFVDQALHGKAKLVIKCQQTWQSVVSAQWIPDSNGLNVAIPYSPVPGTSLQYLAELVDPSTGNPVAISNEVTVTDTGDGKLGNSYTTETCSPNGNGTEIFNTYVNGKLVKTRTVPLTMKGLEVSGVYNPPAALRKVFGLNGKVTLPITNSEVGYGPIPIRVQTPFAFAIDFPDAQPTSVTATFTVNQGYAVNSKGDTSWTVKMSPATNLGFGYWHGYTIMPKLPDGVNIRVSIQATDECGTNTTPTDTFPYDNMITTAGRPEWYFDQPASPGPAN